MLHINLGQNVSCGFLNRICTCVNKRDGGNVWDLEILYNDKRYADRFVQRFVLIRRTVCEWPEAELTGRSDRVGGLTENLPSKKQSIKALNMRLQRGVNNSSESPPLSLSLSLSIYIYLICSKLDPFTTLKRNFFIDRSVTVLHSGYVTRNQLGMHFLKLNGLFFSQVVRKWLVD